MNETPRQYARTISPVVIAFVSCVSFVPFLAAQDKLPSEAIDPDLEPFIQRVLRVNDKNGDRKVTKDEATNQLKKNFDRVDTNGDGEVSIVEVAALAKRMGDLQRNQSTGKSDRAQTEERQAGRRQTGVPENVIFESDIAYRDGNPMWKLDLARPKVAASMPQPAIVVIHGGGWRGGDKGGGQWRLLPLEYAAQGYVCVSVNYRLTDEGNVLDCIADCKCAVRWLRAHAEQYNVDPNRIGAYGNSAGAHLVAMLGLASADAKLEGDGPYQDQSSLVQAVCCSATPSDFTNWGQNKSGSARDALSRLFGDLDIENSKQLASPVTYATDHAPPFLIIHGTSDTTVPIAQGDALERSLREASAKDMTYIKIKGAGHGVFMKHGDKTRPAMKEFFQRVLRITEPSLSE